MTAVILDGDDTLWWAEPLYDDARRRAREIVAASGLDAAEWERLERQIDVKNVAHFGLSRRRFPTSCIQAYELAAKRQGFAPDDEVAQSVFKAADSVFEMEADAVEGASEAVADLASFARLALFTKGDPEVQKKRIADSRLAEYFSLIDVVPNKTIQSFHWILERLGVQARDAWSVGNSLRSDILPAVKLGMNAIWIDAHVWEHEKHIGNVVDPRIRTADHIGRVPDIIRSESEKGTQKAAESS